MARSYWEATAEKWYPNRRAMQYILCRLNEEYTIAKREPNDE